MACEVPIALKDYYYITWLVYFMNATICELEEDPVRIEIVQLGV